MKQRNTRSNAAKRSTTTSSESEDELESEERLELTEAQISELISSSESSRPSNQSISSTSTRKQPLIILSPEELNNVVQGRSKLNDQDENDDDEEIGLFEEVLTDFFWSVPFGFLYYGMDSAVHAQFGMDLIVNSSLKRLANILLTIFTLTFLLSRPQASRILSPLVIQFLLLALCFTTGLSLIHITTTESYLKVMKQAPGLGTLWVWSIVRMDLSFAVLGLLSVAAGVWFRGENGGAIWWS